jgi:thioredoxin reductase (NADPH)
LEKNTLGGLLRNAYLVENYPGFPKGIKGEKLVEQFAKQLQRLKVSITKSEVKNIYSNNETFFIDTNRGSLVTSSIIIATGTIPKKLEIPGSTKIEGTRLFYDHQSILPAEYAGKKRILVIGGGDIAFDYTLTLLSRGHEVNIISRSKLTCLPLLQERAKTNGATIHCRCIPEEIVEHHGDILLRCRQNGHFKEIPTEYIIVACGRDPNLSFLSADLKKHFNNISDIPQTSLPGLYFAGDVTRGTYRQVGVAIGDGIHAAMIVERYLRDRPVTP